jgi:hypothetical protein
MRYDDIEENKWFSPIRKNYRHRCCKCRVVHLLDFRLIKERNGKAIQIRFKRP